MHNIIDTIAEKLQTCHICIDITFGDSPIIDGTFANHGIMEGARLDVQINKLTTLEDIDNILEQMYTFRDKENLSIVKGNLMNRITHEDGIIKDITYDSIIDLPEFIGDFNIKGDFYWSSPELTSLPAAQRALSGKALTQGKGKKFS